MPAKRCDLVIERGVSWDYAFTLGNPVTPSAPVSTPWDLTGFSAKAAFCPGSVNDAGKLFTVGPPVLTLASAGGAGVTEAGAKVTLSMTPAQTRLFAVGSKVCYDLFLYDTLAGVYRPVFGGVEFRAGITEPS